MSEKIPSCNGWNFHMFTLNSFRCSMCGWERKDPRVGDRATETAELSDIERAALLRARYATRYFYIARKEPPWFRKHGTAEEYAQEQRAMGVTVSRDTYNGLIFRELLERVEGLTIITEKGHALLAKKTASRSMCGAVEKNDTTPHDEGNNGVFCKVCIGRAGNRNVEWGVTVKRRSHAFIKEST